MRRSHTFIFNGPFGSLDGLISPTSSVMGSTSPSVGSLVVGPGAGAGVGADAGVDDDDDDDAAAAAAETDVGDVGAGAGADADGNEVEGARSKVVSDGK